MTVTPAAPAADLLAPLVEASVDGLLAFDREVRCVLWNPAMVELTGLRADEVIGRRAFDVFPFLGAIGEDQLVRDALAGRTGRTTGRPFCVEATGRTGFYEATYSPWRVAGGEIVGGIGVIRDTTETTLRGRQLSETELRFSNMADASPVLLWMTGTDGLCTFFNHTWLEFTGRTLEQEWGVGWAAGVHFADLQRCMDIFSDAFNARAVFEMEYRLRRRDGEYRWILDRGVPRHAADGTFAGFIGSCVDITERKQLEHELRAAVRGRDEFLSMASHELRTPLTSLQLQVESLLDALIRRGDDPATPDRVTRSARAALERSLHLGDMIETLLDVSRLSEGRLGLEREPADLARIVHDVIGRLQGQATKAGVTITLTCEASIAGTWDRLRLGQVVTNLVSNAIKYGCGSPVELSLAVDGDQAVLAVADRGQGIPDEQQPYVFDRFVRFASNRQLGGFGLGLWITRELVTLHGGDVSLTSKVGEGTSFTVRLPIERPVDRSTASGAAPPP